MKDEDQITMLNKNLEEAGIEKISSFKPKVLLNVQDENDQRERFEEELAACFLDRMAILL